MEQIKFTKLDNVKELINGWMYLGDVYDDNHDCSCYEFLIYKGDEFLIWDDLVSEYVELDEQYSVLGVAKLNEYGPDIFVNYDSNTVSGKGERDAKHATTHK